MAAIEVDHTANGTRQLLPPMGWNSWNSGVVLDESLVKQTIDVMIATGMRDAGYRYVNLDAGWAAPLRTATGELSPHPDRFPSGIGEVARYAHDRGMLLGIYASPFNQTCGQAVATASAGYERIDAQTFARWGVDFVKYDWCRNDADHHEQLDVFAAMRDALRDTDRQIVYSINPNSSNQPHAGAEYDWSSIADMVRITGDLVPVWDPCASPVVGFDFFAEGIFVGVAEQFAAARTAVARSRPGFWPDPDMLVIGSTWTEFFNGMQDNAREMFRDKEFPPGMQATMFEATSNENRLGDESPQSDLTEAEQRAHFSLWAMLAAPLLTGVDVRTMSLQTLNILTNEEVIAIDQDPLVRQATSLPNDDRVLVKPLADGAVAVAFINFNNAPMHFDVSVDDIGLFERSSYRVRDLWTHTERDVTLRIESGPIPPHGVALLRVTGHPIRSPTRTSVGR